MMNREKYTGSASHKKGAGSRRQTGSGHLPGSSTPAVDAWARGKLYKVFSAAFLFPGPEVRAFFEPRALLRQLEAIQPGKSPSGEYRLAEVVGKLAEYFGSEGFQIEQEQLASSYHALFHIEGGVSPYESEYKCRHEFQKAENLADISGFYRAFGLEMNGERHDHISAQLEFLHVLAFKEAHARGEAEASTPTGEEHVAITIDAERKFLADHLGCWASTFAKAIERQERCAGKTELNRFYATMSRLLEEFVNIEMELLGVGPVTPVAGLRILEAAADDFECPQAAGCTVGGEI